LRDSRDGRNPRTGATVQIPPKKVPFFKAGKELREMVDNNEPAVGTGTYPPDEAPGESPGSTQPVSDVFSGSTEENQY
jgi:hypothetical protein